MCFSALQRAEIAEMPQAAVDAFYRSIVSVLFNEPKLLKWRVADGALWSYRRFSALQRAEIAEINVRALEVVHGVKFQCSSTSRNC